MLDLKFVRERRDRIQEMIEQRDADLDLSEFAGLDEERRRLLAEVEALKHQRNQTNQKITELKKAGQDASALIDEVRSVSTRIKELDRESE